MAQPPAARTIRTMTLLWIFAFSVAAVVAVTTLVDIARHRHFGWATAGWVALILILPFIGSLIYWIVRPTSRDEVEAAYQAEADLHRVGARGSFDGLASQRERDHF